MEIEELFRAAKYDASARYPYFHQYIGQYPDHFYDPYTHFQSARKAVDQWRAKASPLYGPPDSARKFSNRMIKK